MRRGRKDIALEPRHFKLLAFFLENDNAPADIEAMKQGPWSHDSEILSGTIEKACKALSAALGGIGLKVSESKGEWQLAERK